MNILLCVCASVAIYKSCELVRILKKSGHNIKVILSNSASQMISKELFEAISGNEVFVRDSGKMEHISLVRWCEVLVVCPATASTIGKIANGIGGTLILDAILAKSSVPTIIAPAMNVEMWKNAFVRENIVKLKNHGFEILEPESGVLACGEEGIGKLANVQEIAEYISKKTKKNGKTVLITAGGTIEKMDDIRYLTNISSGKQALALAQCFYNQGFDVKIIKAKTDVSFPRYFEIICVESAAEMMACVLKEIPRCDVFISAAAVADFTFNKVFGKVKKTEITKLELVPNPDILQTVCEHTFRPKCVVGFAAESENLEINARDKLERKRCDIMVGNDLVFGKNSTNGVIITQKDQTPFECSKDELSDLIFEKVQEFLSE
jgi:phosphopantothenoylcysteine decarboxylase/phosphopantothenate--cysteine ligase